jgi:hypothetical protein
MNDSYKKNQILTNYIVTCFKVIVQGWKKCFDRGVLPYFQIDLIMNLYQMKAREKWGLSVLNNKDYRNFRMLKPLKLRYFYG